MITIGTKRFAETQSEITNSLFNPGGTVNGFAEVRASGILFEDLRGAPFAFLVANDPLSCFFVNAFRDGGAHRPTRYQNSTNHITERMLGIEGMGYAARHEAATAVWAVIVEREKARQTRIAEENEERDYQWALNHTSVHA